MIRVLPTYGRYTLCRCVAVAVVAVVVLIIGTWQHHHSTATKIIWLHASMGFSLSTYIVFDLGGLFYIYYSTRVYWSAASSYYWWIVAWFVLLSGELDRYCSRGEETKVWLWGCGGRCFLLSLSCSHCLLLLLYHCHYGFFLGLSRNVFFAPQITPLLQLQRNLHHTTCIQRTTYRYCIAKVSVVFGWWFESTILAILCPLPCLLAACSFESIACSS